MPLTKILGPNIIISPPELKGIDSAVLSRFLIDNNTALIKRINDTAKEELLKGERPGFEPAFASDPDFQAKWFNSWYASLRNRLCQASSKGSSLTILFPIAKYLYDAYGLTCSKFLLGCEMPVVPPSWVHHWLTLVDTLDDQTLAQLYSIFDSAPPVVADTLFVLKSRLHEIAAEQGIAPDEFILYPGMPMRDLPSIRAFIQASFQEQNTPYLEMKPHLGGHKLLRMVICMSVLYQVSPDYLLLQDYSNFAVMPNGRYYSPRLRHYMSMLLCADAETRARAVGFVFAAAAQRISAGHPLPAEILQFTEGKTSAAEQPIKLMECFSSNNGATKKEIEYQIVETLKPKLLAVLTLSSEPVSSSRLYEVVDGHIRLVRKALFELEKEGKIEKIPAERGAAMWRSLISSKRKS